MLTAAPTTTLVNSPRSDPTVATTPPAATDRPTSATTTGAAPTQAPGDESTASPTPAPDPAPAPANPPPEGATDPSEPAPPASSAATSVRQGRNLTFAVPADCEDPQFGTLDPGNSVIVDADVNPTTFTVQTANLDLGRYMLNVECQNNIGVQSDLMVFRQNGARRGGAASVLTAGTVGLGSAVAFVGLPGSLTGPRRRRRSLIPPSNQNR